MKSIDPVCKMQVESDTALHSDYKGQTFYFCSKDCLDTFSKDPAKYAKEGKEQGHSHSCC